MEAAAPSESETNPLSGSRRTTSVLLFGDLNFAFEDDLQQLIHRTNNTTVRTYIDQLGRALHQEISQLSIEQQAWLPSFTNIVELIDRMSGAAGAAALRSGLLCAYQICRFIESDCLPDPTNSYIVGVCTGSFAAVAVSIAPSLVRLADAGIEVALVAFRTALHTLTVGHEIEPSISNDAASWSMVVNTDYDRALEILKQFNARSRLATSSQPYVSAASANNVTISGPPTSLKNLVEFAELRTYTLPIQSPYHAPHLYGPQVVDKIMSRVRLKCAAQYKGRIPVVSIETGAVIDPGTNFMKLLRRAVEESLYKQVRWDKTYTGLASILGERKDIRACSIVPVASNAASQLSTVLQKLTTTEFTILDEMNSSVNQNPAGPRRGRFADSEIAIIGYSGRFPEASCNEEFWEVLKSARDCHRTIPADRFDWQAHCDPSGKLKNSSRVKFGCFINDPGVFDARFFNLSPREAENTDPAQRLLLMSAYEAMEMAGFVPGRTISTKRDRVGVFMGVTSDDWREVNSGQIIDTYFIPGGNRAFVPGRISYFFGLSGPSISVDTACSSSLAAISTACNYLWRGDCDAVIAGGTNILTNPDNFAGLDRGHFLSTTGNCNPFDDSASGYCRADAVGSVILKRKEDALADRDPIFGVIVGASTVSRFETEGKAVELTAMQNHCGQSVSITRPNESDQLLLFQHIMRQTNTDPNDIGYCEMHGTGTQAGDAAEMKSVLSAMASNPHRDLPLYLGAVKANVGHSESASGVTALIKVLLMMKHSEIPPHRLNGALNRHYPTDMAKRNVHIAFKTAPWRRQDTRRGQRMAFLNNFSAAGGNTALLLEDAPEIVASVQDESSDRYSRSYWPIAVSAKTKQAFEANLLALASHLNESQSLADLSYTTTARRAHYRFRTLVVADTVTSLRTTLLENREKSTQLLLSKGIPTVTFVFTGQGAFYPGMGKQLFSEIPSFRQDVVSYDRIVQSQTWPSILPWINALELSDMPEAPTIITHLGLTCLQMALSRLWARWYGEPSSVVGHSLGEYAALFAAGVLSANDTIYLVGSRSALLDEKCVRSTHAMLVLKAGAEVVRRGLSGTSCAVACMNSPTSTVVSGPRSDVSAVADWFRTQNIESFTLDLPFAFHSEQVQPILTDFSKIAASVQFKKPRVPFISPLFAEVVQDDGILGPEYLTRATRECVNFLGAIEHALRAKVVDQSTIWLEIGPHPLCMAMIKQSIGSDVNTACSLRKGEDCWKVLTASLQILYNAGTDINWEGYHGDCASSRRVLQLPAYQWDLETYWIQYRNNFCLTKGDNPPSAGVADTHGFADATPAVPISSSLHKIVEETMTSDQSRLVVESDIHDPRLKSILTGHRVNNVMLCPSSLYADMALTMTRYMLRNSGNTADDHRCGLDCADMSIERPLIARPDATTQLMRISASAAWKDNLVKLTIYSVNTKAEKLVDHASCVIKVTEKVDWLNLWKRNSYLVQSRIASLRASVDNGAAHKLKRGLAYKLFSNLVDYDASYQGMEQVILDSESLEATAEVRFQVGVQGFEFNPCWIDSLGHIAGFIMNGNDNLHSRDSVFVNHGWESMRCAVPIDGDKTYTTYNRMQLTTGTTYVGDTYIFDNERCIGIFQGVKFQGIKRTVLNQVLPRPTEVVDQIRHDQVAVGRRTTEASTIGPCRQKEPAARYSQTAGSDITQEALKVISQEVQLDEKDVDLGAKFTDLGIDSLLSLTIASRMQAELELDVSSADFAAFPTVSALLGHITSAFVDAAPPPTSSQMPSGTSTPPSIARSGEKAISTAASSVSEIDEAPHSDVMGIITKVFSDEIGVSLDQLSSRASLSELGVDSLLGLTIIGTLTEKFDLRLPPNLFAEHDTLGEVESTLERLNIIRKPKTALLGEQDRANRTLEKATARLVDLNEASGAPHAHSVLLQGSARSAERLLFFFPDGAGSATSYQFIPAISSNLAVYGLNCPWLRTPEGLRCSLEQYVAKFLVEVRRRQPQGPYHLGGASAGGILAYEAAQQLSRAGERVERLVLLDTPDPIGLENPNERLYDFLDSQGMFGISVAGQAPKWLRPHFDAFLALLDAYEVQEFTGPSPPQTYMVYAEDGMCKHAGDRRPEVRPGDPREMLWLLNNRTDFSGAGWNKLLGSRNLHIDTLQDVNHYTILQDGPAIQRLTGLIAKAMSV